VVSWRISKYDPSRRDSRGRYMVAEWTSVHDIGKAFAGRELTVEEYQRVEDAYVATVEDFYLDAGRPPLRALGVESTGRLSRSDLAPVPSALSNDAEIGPAELADLIRACLRELNWCRLESTDRDFAIHFGYDFYVYVTCMSESRRPLDAARDRNLFVEPHESPYGTSERDEQ